MENQTLTWIHLSDLHMNEEDEFNRKIVLDALWQDIQNIIANGIRPDFVAFTGDVSFHGSAEEYKLAIKEFFNPLLDVTRLDKSRLFVIPGNHDVNRKKASLIKNPISTIATEDDIRKLLQSSEHKELLLTPFSNYADFIRSYLRDGQKLEVPEFYFCEDFVVGDFLISIVGLNSAWLSSYNLGCEWQD